MLFKKITLLVIAVITVAVVFHIPFYAYWLNSKFNDEPTRISEQADRMSVEERMEARFGSTYMVQRSIANMLNSFKAQNSIILLPPQSYLNAMKPEGGTFEVPEPAVFYYFTGYRAVNKDSKEVSRATWAILAENHRMVLKHLTTPRSIDSVLQLLKPYN